MRNSRAHVYRHMKAVSHAFSCTAFTEEEESALLGGFSFGIDMYSLLAFTPISQISGGLKSTMLLSVMPMLSIMMLSKTE